jgi:hypothetical protein
VSVTAGLCWAQEPAADYGDGTPHICAASEAHEGRHRCCCGHVWGHESNALDPRSVDTILENRP